jgi:hypothetical protein
MPRNKNSQSSMTVEHSEWRFPTFCLCMKGFQRHVKSYDDINNQPYHQPRVDEPRGSIKMAETNRVPFSL